MQKNLRLRIRFITLLLLSIFCFNSSASATPLSAQFDRAWKKEEARQYLEQYGRLQKTVAKLHVGLEDEFSKSSRSLPFTILNFLGAKFWKAYGVEATSGIFVAAIPNSSNLPDSKVQMGDEVIAVEGFDVNNFDDFAQKLKEFKKSSLILKFKRSSHTWEENIPIIINKQEIFNFLMFDNRRWAFASGQNIVVTTKMMDFIKNDDELAFVLAHEMAHVRLRHQRGRNRTDIGKSVISTLVTALLNATLNYVANAGNSNNGVHHYYPPSEFESAIGDEVGGALMSGFEQKQERQADRLAVKFMMASGFNPENSLDLWRRWDETTGNRKDYSHPEEMDRRQYILEEIEQTKREEENKGKIKKDKTLEPPIAQFGNLEVIKAVNLITPELALASVINAKYFKKIDFYMDCLTDDYFKNTETTPEALKSEILKTSGALPFEAYDVIQFTKTYDKDDNVTAKVVFKTKTPFRDPWELPDTAYVSLFRKIDNKWKLYDLKSARGTSK